MKTKTREWVASFIGREVGAIGVMGRHYIHVNGKDKEEANINIYKTHEHITSLTLEEIKEV